MKKSVLVLACTALLVWFGVNGRASAELENYPTDPTQVSPLEVGQSVPDAVVYSSEEKLHPISSLLKGKPALLIFYRGGWCPYCNTHLEEVASIESKLGALGYQIVAISPDSPERVAELEDKHSFGYRMYSDSDMDAARAFGLVFRVTDEQYQQYKDEFGLDLEAHSGRKHHLLPVPAAFIIDRSGKVRYRYANPNYKTRVSAEQLLDEATRVVTTDK